MTVQRSGDNYRCVSVATNNSCVDAVDCDCRAFLNRPGDTLGQGEVFRHFFGKFHKGKLCNGNFFRCGCGLAVQRATAVEFDCAVVVYDVTCNGNLVADCKCVATFALKTEALNGLVNSVVDNDSNGDVAELFAVSVVDFSDNARQGKSVQGFAAFQSVCRIHHVNYKVEGECLCLFNSSCLNSCRQSNFCIGSRHCNSKVSAVYNNRSIVGRPRNGNVGVRRACHGKSGCAVFRVGEFVYFQGCKFGVNLFLVGVGDVVGFREADLYGLEVHGVLIQSLFQREVGVSFRIGNNFVHSLSLNGAQHHFVSEGIGAGAELEGQRIGVVAYRLGIRPSNNNHLDSCVERIGVFDCGVVGQFVGGCCRCGLGTHLDAVAVISKFRVFECHTVDGYCSVLIALSHQLHCVYVKCNSVISKVGIGSNGNNKVLCLGFVVVGYGSLQRYFLIFRSAGQLGNAVFDGDTCAFHYFPSCICVKFEILFRLCRRSNKFVHDCGSRGNQGFYIEELNSAVHNGFAVFQGVGYFYRCNFVLVGSYSEFASVKSQRSGRTANFVSDCHTVGFSGKSEFRSLGDTLVCTGFFQSSVYSGNGFCCRLSRVNRSVGVSRSADNHVACFERHDLCTLVVAQHARYAYNVAFLNGAGECRKSGPCSIVGCGFVGAFQVLGNSHGNIYAAFGEGEQCCRRTCFGSGFHTLDRPIGKRNKSGLMIDCSGNVTENVLVERINMLSDVDFGNVGVNNEVAACVGFDESVVVGVGCSGDCYVSAHFNQSGIGAVRLYTVHVVTCKEFFVHYVQRYVAVTFIVRGCNFHNVTFDVDGNACVVVPVVDFFKVSSVETYRHCVLIGCRFVVVGECSLNPYRGQKACGIHQASVAVFADCDVIGVCVGNAPIDSCSLALVGEGSVKSEVFRYRRLILYKVVVVGNEVNVKLGNSHSKRFTEFADGYRQSNFFDSVAQRYFCQVVAVTFFQSDCAVAGCPRYIVFTNFDRQCEVGVDQLVVLFQKIGVKRFFFALVACDKRNATEYENQCQQDEDYFSLHSFLLIFLLLQINV